MFLFVSNKFIWIEIQCRTVFIEHCVHIVRNVLVIILFVQAYVQNILVWVF
nr:MAG TPA: hypothetical protein [Microviridae sp.]